MGKNAERDIGRVHPMPNLWYTYPYDGRLLRSLEAKRSGKKSSTVTRIIITIIIIIITTIKECSQCLPVDVVHWHLNLQIYTVTFH